MNRLTILFLLALAPTTTFAGGGSIGSGENDSTEINQDKATSYSIDELKRYPAPEKDKKRIAIHLSGKTPKEARNSRVEILVGKKMQVDCNLHIGGSQLQAVTSEVSFLPSIKASTKIQVASTAMACPTRELKEAFVEGDRLMVQYDSFTPIVIYADKDAVIKYRVWNVSDDFSETQ